MIKFYDVDGQTLIYYHNFSDLRPNQSEDTAYVRGIASVEPNLIAIGNLRLNIQQQKCVIIILS